jgi:hypothetical protein
MKLTQKQVINTVQDLLSKLNESTHNTSAQKAVEKAMEIVESMKDLLKNGDGFYDQIIFMNEKTLIEVDLEQRAKVE